MKCKMCGGAGVIQGQAPGLVSCCPACGGKGFVNMTNEEWIKSANTMDLAMELARLCCTAREKTIFGYYETLGWLKAVHKE